MNVDLHFNINLTDGQKEAYRLYKDPAVKELVLTYSRQSGKTTLCEIMLIETLVSKKCNAAYISPSFSQGKKVYRELMQLLSDTGLISKKNSSDLTFELINGSTMQFFSAKNATAIRGFTISGILIIDECAFLPEVTPDGQNLYHNIIKPVTKSKKPLVVFVSTPNGKTGIYYEKYLEGLKEDGQVRTVVSNIYRDSTISTEDIEQLKKETPPLAWRQEFLCEFLDNALTVFTAFEGQFTDNEELTKIDKNKSVWIGVDLSSTEDGDETILTVVDKDGRNQQWKITGSLDVKYKKIAEIIDSFPNVVAVYMEANGIGLPIINEIKKLVKRHKSKLYYWTTTNENKNEMVGALALLIANKEIWFSKIETELYQQFGVFTYKINKNTRNITYNARDGYHDDRIMSLMIALRCRNDYPYSGASNVIFIKTGAISRF